MGQLAENIAKEFFIKKKFVFIEQNYSTRVGEIDLIFMDGDSYVFVEVRSIRQRSGFFIFESLTKAKKKKLHCAINMWLAEHQKEGSIWRVDFLGVTFSDHHNYSIDYFPYLQLD